MFSVNKNPSKDFSDKSNTENENKEEEETKKGGEVKEKEVE